MAASTTKKTPAPKASGARSATNAASTEETAAKPRTAKAKAAKAAPQPSNLAAPELDRAAAGTAAAPPSAVEGSSAPPVPSREAIAQRAYEIWRAEGGHALDNWLRAERELGA
jgi:hypothetical protein